MTYAVISLGGKQYRVAEGQTLFVDRLSHAEGKTFHPEIILVGGDGDTELSPKGVTVTAKLVGHVPGKKIRIGKYKPKKGYRRHTGYRGKLSRVEIQSIAKKSARAAKPKEEAAAEKPKKPAARKTTKKDES